MADVFSLYLPSLLVWNIVKIQGRVKIHNKIVNLIYASLHRVLVGLYV